MAAVNKFKKMQQFLIEKAMTSELVQKTLRKVDERVLNSLLDEFDHGCRVRPLPSSSERGDPTEVTDRDDLFAHLEGGGHRPGEELDGAPKDGDSPGELDEAPRARAMRMDVGSCYVQNHDEDSHFVHAGTGVVGAADGVSAFRKKGVDAAAFARALMDNGSAAADRAAAAKPGTPLCPYALLREAYGQAVRASTPGASTAAFVTLHGTTLKWSYVGDSAFAVLRGGEIVHRSTPQQNRFNCPFQLRSSKGGDRVADADVGEVPAAEGDVVVVGAVGLFDNVFDEELERVVRKCTGLGLSPQDMADNVAGTACEVSRRRVAHSPFSIERWRQGIRSKKRFCAR